jgi:hypothetical protein
MLEDSLSQSFSALKTDLEELYKLTDDLCREKTDTWVLPVKTVNAELQNSLNGEDSQFKKSFINIVA